ncbi:MAG: hypothetical protein IPI07_11000 [Flavobacteriales bacterium]|nr:hypothetical protein [Flavobacteriales bacterium]
MHYPPFGALIDFCPDEPPYFDYVAGVGINFFGGTPPYTYQIFAGSPVNLWRTGSTSGPGIAFGDPLPVNIPSQNYYSTVTDANGCVRTQGPVVCAEWRRVVRTPDAPTFPGDHMDLTPFGWDLSSFVRIEQP